MRNYGRKKTSQEHYNYHTLTNNAVFPTDLISEPQHYHTKY